MKISISSLAWEKNEEKDVIKILKRNNINLIDITPSKYFKSCMETNKQDILDLKNYFSRQSIYIYGMQSILYEIKHLNLFRNKSEREIIVNYLEKIFEIGDLLDARKIVFGAPSSRYKLSSVDTNIEYEFFSRIASIASKYDVTICLEPAPKVYKCNFLNTTSEVAIFIKSINNYNLKLQIDSGSIQINEENIVNIINDYSSIIGHLHISNPFLKPIIDNVDFHKSFCNHIVSNSLLKVITIEMLTSKKSLCIKEVEESVKFINKLYLNI